MNPADDALAEALRAGIDLNSLDYNLALSPYERLLQHESGLKVCQVLQEIGVYHPETHLAMMSVNSELVLWPLAKTCKSFLRKKAAAIPAQS